MGFPPFKCTIYILEVGLKKEMKRGREEEAKAREERKERMGGRSEGKREK